MPTPDLSIRDAVMARMAKKALSACRVCAFLERQSPEDRATWRELMAQHPTAVQHTAVADEMTDRLRAVDPMAQAITMDHVSKHRAKRHDATVTP